MSEDEMNDKCRRMLWETFTTTKAPVTVTILFTVTTAA